MGFKGLLLAKDVSPTSKWNDVIKTCSSDSRCEACSTLGERKQALAEYQTKRANELREEKRQEKESMREELFHDFVEEARKREERLRRGRRRDAKNNFIAFLKYREDGGGLTFASTWTSFLASLNNEDKADSRFTISPSMSDSDR